MEVTGNTKVARTLLSCHPHTEVTMTRGVQITQNKGGDEKYRQYEHQYKQNETRLFSPTNALFY